MRTVRFGLLVAVVGAPLVACSSKVSVRATTVDQEYLGQVRTSIPSDPFYIPATLRFEGTLKDGDAVKAPPNLAFSKRGDEYYYPVYDVIRNAATIAVERSFKESDPPAEFLRDDELVVELRTTEVVMETEGGAGDALCAITIAGEVLNPLTGVTIHTFSVPVEMRGRINQDGTGAQGPGVLWLAAGQLAERLARELQSEGVRERFRDKSRWVIWLSSADGVPPPPGKVPKYDVRNSWGEYRPVVKLR